MNLILFSDKPNTKIGIYLKKNYMEIKSTNINETNASLFKWLKKRPQHMSMEIQFLAWDWYKHVSGSI
jgi:hypothetical protein